MKVVYTRAGKVTRLEVADSKQWELIDFVRAHFHPDVVPSKSEPAFLEAVKIRRESK